MYYNHIPTKPFLALFLLFSISNFSCTQSVYPDEADIKEFFSQFGYLSNSDSAANSFYHKKIFVIDSALIDWEKEAIGYIEKKDSLIGKEREWFKQQLNNSHIVTWDTSFFNSPLIKQVEIVPKIYIDSLFHHSPTGFNRLRIEYIHLGIPLFSRDRKYCLLIFDQWCGSLCAETAIIVYKKVDGKWKRYKIYSQSVS